MSTTSSNPPTEADLQGAARTAIAQLGLPAGESEKDYLTEDFLLIGALTPTLYSDSIEELLR